MEDSEYFIATQGPLKSSISHFWKMVWNENSDFIIMLCRLQESGKVKLSFKTNYNIFANLRFNVINIGLIQILLLKFLIMKKKLYLKYL